MNKHPSHLSQCVLPVIVILVLPLLVGSLLPVSSVHAQAESVEADQQSTAVVGAYGNLNEHHKGRFSLYRTGDRITATFTTTRSPVHYWAHQHTEPLFHVPSDFRPPIPVIREVEGHHVLIDGTPDPAQPNPRRFQLKVDPDGAVRYVGNSDLDGAGYLAYTLETIWGVSLAAHFAALGEVLTESWSRSGFTSLPVVPYVAPKPTASATPEGPSLTLALNLRTFPHAGLSPWRSQRSLAAQQQNCWQSTQWAVPQRTGRLSCPSQDGTRRPQAGWRFRRFSRGLTKHRNSLNRETWKWSASLPPDLWIGCPVFTSSSRSPWFR